MKFSLEHFCITTTSVVRLACFLLLLFLVRESPLEEDRKSPQHKEGIVLSNVSNIKVVVNPIVSTNQSKVPPPYA